MKTPKSIYDINAFMRSPAAGFDGVFNWDWIDGCFGDTKITPMDFDGVVERKGNFLVFETKKRGIVIPMGQIYTFEALIKLHKFTIFFIVGKEYPEELEVWYDNEVKKDYGAVSVEFVRNKIISWYKYADK